MFRNRPFAGTPLRTLPARIRPLVRRNGEYWATDGQFVRDSACRAIQRGLITRNRFDQDMTEQLKKASRVAWDGFSDTISNYFSGQDWKTASVPEQRFPIEVAEILKGLDSLRPKGWLEFDAQLRDLSGESRENLASLVRQVLPSLDNHPVRSFLFASDAPLQVFLHVADHPAPTEGFHARTGLRRGHHSLNPNFQNSFSTDHSR